MSFPTANAGRPGSPDPRHYSGVVVIVRGERMQACIRDLDALDGVEVHYSHPESSRLIVTLESNTLEQQEETLQRVRAVHDVVLAELVYHYVDSEPDDALSRGPRDSGVRT